MPYFAKVMLCSPQFTVQQDCVLLGCPKDLLRRWLEEGHVELRGSEERPLIDLPFSDLLSDLSQAELVQVILLNKLPPRPTNVWPDEMIRQAIRQCVPDLTDLELPNVAGTPSGQPA